MAPIRDLTLRAQRGDRRAFELLVDATQAMAYALARRVLRDPAAAEDAVQVAYLQAFRRLADLHDAAAFPGWLRRIVISVALNARRAHRTTLLRLDDVAEVPVLDETETTWSDTQRQQLAAALLTLTAEERQLCDRRYHGRWSTARLASQSGVDEATIRKRLQRVREKLRREIEMSERQAVPEAEFPRDLPGRVIELLARPRLTDLPENPVGRIAELLRPVFPDCADVQLPEIVDLSDALASAAGAAIYVEPAELHHIDANRILRYDLTLPLLMTLRAAEGPLRVWSTGKAYRLGRLDATHLEAFHQAEVFLLDDRDAIDPWSTTGRVLQSMDGVLPGRSVRLTPTAYAMCSQAWELSVEWNGQWHEVMAWGLFTDAIVRHVGGNPSRQAAVGIGYGLERVAMIRYDIDDIRKIDVASVA